MLRLSVTFSDTQAGRKTASLRICFPYDEFVSLHFADPRELVMLLQTFKQTSLANQVKAFFQPSEATEQAPHHRLVTNPAVA